MAKFLKQFESIIQGRENLPAYLLEDKAISLGEVNALANRFARWLLKALPEDEVVVGICIEESLITGPLLLGILKAGKVFLGLDPSYPPERLRHMVQQSGCTLVITDESNTGRFGNANAHLVQDVIQAAQEMEPSNLPHLEDDERPAYVTFTSGSTGLPKAVLAPVRQVDNRFFWMWEEYPFGQSEVCCQRMPLSFIDTLWEIVGPVCKATPVALISYKRVPAGLPLIKELSRHNVTRIWMLPAALNALVEMTPNLNECLPRLRFWVCTGDTLSPALVRKFYRAMPHARLYNLYGTSEVWDATWCQVPSESSLGLNVPIGKAIRNVDVIVVDEKLHLLPSQVRGEIAIGGSGLATGYIRGSVRAVHKATRRVVDCGESEWYLTGDIGYMSEDGNLIFLGRREAIVSRAGDHISLVEVEAALTLHPSVMEGAVASYSSNKGEVTITGYYCVKQGAELPQHDLMRFIQNHLPNEALPDLLVQLANFPMTPSGKIDRLRLREWEKDVLLCKSTPQP